MIVHPELPRDSVMLLSVINTKLRDRYETLYLLCEDMGIDANVLKQQLKDIDYEYDDNGNQFI